ncbi:MAG TPA: peroxiredoxin [Thermoplasmata archaeon]|nr:peroxiredoxin [Thermoplasmata archaeon]
MIESGQVAPDFVAPDQDRKPFTLSSLRGAPVVLYFYPEADTSGCTVEAKGFQNFLSEFAAKNVHIVGVSTDDCAAQKAFANKYGLRFPLIADAKKEVATKYGVLKPSGRARRVTFLIDALGKVVEVVDTPSAETHVVRARERFLKA